MNVRCDCRLSVPAIVLGILLAAPALAVLPPASAAAQDVEYAPGYEPGAPRPEAADKTLGMAIMSASVYEDGTLALGAGVASSVRVFTGAYLVVFNRNLSNCFCTASPGGRQVAPVTGSATATCPWAPEEGVWVRTSVGETNVDKAFQLIVFCPK